ncbi:MAG: hypothetical protein JXB07_01235 [Anaerolineae bacterium]|nr:hypothetical protein [Anaerolineae bacterium]
MNDIGLLSVLPITYFVALFALIASFCVLLCRNDAPDAVLALHILALIVMIQSTPPLLYGTLRYSWAWKHVGIVDYIMRHQSVNPAIRNLDAYHNWPGFFTLSALITEVAGLDSPLILAVWAGVFFDILFFGALLLVYRTLTDDRRLSWLGILIFFLTNWIGQDYYCPQAMAYFLYLVVVGVCLTWFRSSLTLQPSKVSQWPLVRHGLSLIEPLLDRARTGAVEIEKSDSFTRVVLMSLTILAAFAIVASHQLTPVMLIGAILFLSLARQINTRGLPAIVILLTLTWILFVATRFLGNNIQDIIDSAGQVSGNVSSNLIDVDTTSPGQSLVALIGRILTISIWLLAFLGGIRRLTTGSIDLAAIMLMVGPTLIPVGNAYGGEILFRVYLFTIPSIAFFAASFFYPSKHTQRGWLWLGALYIVCTLFLIGYFFANLGKDRQYRFTQDEIAGANYLIDFAPQNTLLITGSTNYPFQFRNYEYFVSVPITSEPKESRDAVVADPVGVLSRWLDNPSYTATYLILTRSQAIASDALGYLPPGELDRIEQALRASDRFIPVFQNHDVVIFVLNKQPSGEP